MNEIYNFEAIFTGKSGISTRISKDELRELRLQINNAYLKMLVVTDVDGDIFYISVGNLECLILTIADPDDSDIVITGNGFEEGHQ